MKDERVAFIKKALDSLIESLDATVRVHRWSEVEAIPEPLKEASSRLLDRLGAADRLSSSTFVGSPTDVARVKAIFASMVRLDAAYVAYRQECEAMPSHQEDAARTLIDEIDAVRSH